MFTAYLIRAQSWVNIPLQIKTGLCNHRSMRGKKKPHKFSGFEEVILKKSLTLCIYNLWKIIHVLSYILNHRNTFKKKILNVSMSSLSPFLTSF